jgi:hypothetical protein
MRSDHLFRAEEETRKKTEKSNEIKKINTQIMILKSDITKMEDTLKEYNLYKKFLDKVTPQDLKEVRLKELSKFSEDKEGSNSEAKSQQDKNRKSGNQSYT